MFLLKQCGFNLQKKLRILSTVEMSLKEVDKCKRGRSIELLYWVITRVQIVLRVDEKLHGWPAVGSACTTTPFAKYFFVIDGVAVFYRDF